MKQFQLKTLLSAVAILSLLSACRKDKVNPTPEVPETGVYVLSQGGITHNNSTLSFYSYISKATTPDIFSAANGRGLGDTGNDAKIYGSKMYITVNYSSTLEIVDAHTVKSIKQIKMADGGTDRQPRFVVFDKGKAFVSSYDGTVAVLDTATLTIDKYIKVGRNPEQMVVSNGKLYVANSGGLDQSNPDKTVSVINLTSLTEIKKIDITSTNPINIAADAYGDIYVIAYGTDYPAKPTLTIIDNNTDAVKTTTDIDAGYGTPFIVNGDLAYYLTDAGKVKVYNVKTETVVKENFITDGTTFKVAFALSVNPATGEVYVADAIDYSSNGKLYIFDKNGKNENAADKKGYLTETGINPGAIILLNK
jgi:YVTN family beta-propeller protein